MKWDQNTNIHAYRYLRKFHAKYSICIRVFFHCNLKKSIWTVLSLYEILLCRFLVYVNMLFYIFKSALVFNRHPHSHVGKLLKLHLTRYTCTYTSLGIWDKSKETVIRLSTLHYYAFLKGVITPFLFALLRLSKRRYYAFLCLYGIKMSFQFALLRLFRVITPLRKAL